MPALARLRSATHRAKPHPEPPRTSLISASDLDGSHLHLASALASPTYLHAARGPLHAPGLHSRTPSSAACLAAAGLSPVRAPARSIPCRALCTTRTCSPVRSSLRRSLAFHRPLMRSARGERGSARGRGPPSRGRSHGTQLVPACLRSFTLVHACLRPLTCPPRLPQLARPREQMARRSRPPPAVARRPRPPRYGRGSPGGGPARARRVVGVTRLAAAFAAVHSLIELLKSLSSSTGAASMSLPLVASNITP